MHRFYKLGGADFDTFYTELRFCLAPLFLIIEKFDVMHHFQSSALPFSAPRLQRTRRSGMHRSYKLGGADVGTCYSELWFCLAPLFMDIEKFDEMYQFQSSALPFSAPQRWTWHGARCLCILRTFDCFDHALMHNSELSSSKYHAYTVHVPPDLLTLITHIHTRMVLTSRTYNPMLHALECGPPWTQSLGGTQARPTFLPRAIAHAVPWQKTNWRDRR